MSALSLQIPDKKLKGLSHGSFSIKSGPELLRSASLMVTFMSIIFHHCHKMPGNLNGRHLIHGFGGFGPWSHDHERGMM